MSTSWCKIKCSITSYYYYKLKRSWKYSIRIIRSRSDVTTFCWRQKQFTFKIRRLRLYDSLLFLNPNQKSLFLVRQKEYHAHDKRCCHFSVNVNKNITILYLMTYPKQIWHMKYRSIFSSSRFCINNCMPWWSEYGLHVVESRVMGAY